MFEFARNTNLWTTTYYILALLLLQYTTPISSRCLYHRSSARPRRNQYVKRINFQNNMVFSLDVKINRWPRSTWANIFHCGNSNGVRQPAMWINKRRYLHIVYGTRRHGNKLKNLHHIRLGRNYKIEWRVRRRRYDVYVNGRRWFSVRGRHHNRRNQRCYIGDPWYEAANAQVRNIKIMTGTNTNQCGRSRRGSRHRGQRGHRGDVGHTGHRGHKGGRGKRGRVGIDGVWAFKKAFKKMKKRMRGERRCRTSGCGHGTGLIARLMHMGRMSRNYINALRGGGMQSQSMGGGMQSQSGGMGGPAMNVMSGANTAINGVHGMIQGLHRGMNGGMSTQMNGMQMNGMKQEPAVEVQLNGEKTETKSKSKKARKKKKKS